jgi:hypothetical protein
MKNRNTIKYYNIMTGRLKKSELPKEEKRKLPTKKQIAVLACLAYAPIGRGLTYKQTAEFLGISTQAVISRIKFFKRDFPQEWHKFRELRKIGRKQGLALHHINFLGSYENNAETVAPDCTDTLTLLEEESENTHLDRGSWVQEHGRIVEKF